MCISIFLLAVLQRIFIWNVEMFCFFLFLKCWFCPSSQSNKYHQQMRKKYPYSELFWSAFSRIRAEYGEILRIYPYSVRMRENTDQNISQYQHFLRSANDDNSTIPWNFFLHLPSSCAVHQNDPKWQKIICSPQFMVNSGGTLKVQSCKLKKHR